MKKIISTLLVVVVLTSNSNFVKAQVDPHFSQYYVFPSWLNPALTGAFDGDYRVSAIHRSQWGSIVKAYKTTGVSADFTTNKNLNLGVSILNQTAGDGGYHYTTAYASAAFTGVRFGFEGTQHLVFGLQGGIINRGFNPSKLTFGDQWNPITGYNPGVASTDVLKTKDNTTFDAGAGVLYYDGKPGKKANLFAGFSASHITQPTDPFSVGAKEKLPVRYTLHAGVKLQVADGISITPNALYLKQGTAEEKMLGAYAQLRSNYGLDFLIGGNYRFEDAISPYVGFYYKSFTLGLSYDVGTSDLSKSGRNANTFEISLTLIGKKKAKFTEENFICPRL